MRNCAIIPKVKNKNGQVVDSKLFKSLLSYNGNNRSNAIKLYLITKNPEFMNNWGSNLIMDDNNEPTLSSLLNLPGINKFIPVSKIIDKFNMDLFGKKESPIYEDTRDNYLTLVRKAIDFNSQSELKGNYVALLRKIYDNEKSRNSLKIEIESRTKSNVEEARKMEYNYILNSKLREILESKGVSVGVLNSLEQRMGLRGVSDFDTSKTMADGMLELIRISDGIYGEQALPEEFAHFALESLGNSPLTERLYKILENNEVLHEILGNEFDTYNTLYNGNIRMLAKESAGKILTRHLLEGKPIEKVPYKNLLTRVIEAIKNFFKSFDSSEIRRAIYYADKQLGELAKNILTGNTENIKRENIVSSDKFYQVDERVRRDKELLQKIINNELKRLKIYEKRNPNSQFDINQRIFIDELEKELSENNEIEGINTFLSEALKILMQLRKRVKDISESENSDYSLKYKASVILDIRNYLYSYGNISDEIRKALLDEEKYEDNRYGQSIRNSLDNILVLIEDLFTDLNNMSVPVFLEYIRPFMGDSVNIPFGKWAGTKLTAEDLLKGIKKDSDGNVLWFQEEISVFDRYLDSMADSSDSMLRIMDQAVKKSKEQARLRTIDTVKELQEAGVELERAGIKNTDWMFERDEEGNLTGDYISEIDYKRFRKNISELYRTLREKYGEHPVGEDLNNYILERKEWYRNNVEDGKPKASVYTSNEYRNLNQAQKKYYNTVIRKIKATLDSYLPETSTYLENAVKIRKDLVERVINSENLKSGGKQIWESIKDQFIRRSDDIDFGDKIILKDFENRLVQSLPIYYTKLGKNENPNDLSTDVVSTLSAYAAMAYEFDEMNKVIDVLELGRNLMRDREIVQTSGNRTLAEKFTVMNRTVKSNLTEKGDKTNTGRRLNDFFDMQVYNRYMADEGTFGKSNIDKGKTANVVNMLTSLSQLAFNVLSGISNIATGTVMMRIESLSGEFFNMKNTITADREYGKNLLQYVSEIGNKVKTSKLALWDELFNVMQEYEQEVREMRFGKSWFGRMFNSSTLFFMNNAGEHWMQNRTSLALADAYKMKSPEGKIVSLWDAMEVVYKDKNNKSLGAKLQVKEGYTKEDGSEFTQSDIIKFSRKCAAINQRMHGIYNKADRNAAQNTAIGRMAILFRKWMKPSWNRRFALASYNHDLESWTEGYYTTAGRFIIQLCKELRWGQFNLMSDFKNLTRTEKANIIKAIVEVSHFTVLALFIGLLEWPDDLKNRPWLMRTLEYQARRLYTEIGAMIPGKPMIVEGLRILKSPAAGIKTMESLLNLTKLLGPWNYMDELQSGRYEGHSTAYKAFFESPFVPFYRTVYRGIHPEESLPFYN